MTEKTTASSTFSVLNWEENPFKEYEGERKLTQANVKYNYQGELAGESEVRYVMSYGPRGASFVGVEVFAGSIAGRSGTFVLQHVGADDGSGVRSHFFVVPGSASGELEGLRGEGEILLAGHAERYPITLEFWFEG